MMIADVDFLSNAVDYFTGSINKYFNLLKQFVAWVFAHVAESGEAIFSNLLDVVGPMFPGTTDITAVSATFNKINFFFPLSEMITLITALGTLWLAVWLFRMVRSFTL